jgi:N6-adenosine-specific RNA methylase IME4
VTDYFRDKIRRVTAARRVDPGPVPHVAGGFGTILIDPAWSFRNKCGRLAPENVEGGYETMSDSAILALPVRERAARRSHIYLFVTDAHLHLGLHCLEAWDFVFIQTLVWGKRTAKNGVHRVGGGNYFRHVHENLLFGVRGQAPAARHDLISRFDAVNQGHSVKPQAIHAIAEAMSPGPRLEMFARRHHSGWTCWGDQLPRRRG